MGIFDGVLLASDFDGTLACDGAVVAQRDANAIKYFIAQGGRFTVSTGRTYQGFHLYSPEYINAPVLLCNGTMLYDYKAEKVCFCNPIDEYGIEPVRELLRNFPECAIEIYPFNKTFAINPNETVDRHITGQDISYSVISDPAESVFPWIKAMIEAGKNSQAVQGFLEEKKFSGIKYIPTRGNYVELIACGNDKGTGLMRLAETLGISPEHVYAAGDGYNDHEMLKAAHAGFVPVSGDTQLKAAAQYTVRSNNDGCIENVIEILSGIYLPER